MTHPPADKNHEASPLRRQKAKSEGDFPRSFELAVALQVIGFTIVGFLSLESISASISAAATQSWKAGSIENLSGETSAVAGLDLVSSALWAVVPLMLGSWLVVVASHWVQTGPVWQSGKISADVGRLSPGNWAGQVFSMSTWSYMFVGVPKFVLAITVAAVSFWCQRETIFAMPFQPINQMSQTIVSVLMQITFHVGFVLLASSAIDYWIHYLGFEKRIRMTDQELREEIRAQDGDPTVNAQRKSLSNSF